MTIYLAEVQISKPWGKHNATVIIISEGKGRNSHEPYKGIDQIDPTTC